MENIVKIHTFLEHHLENSGIEKDRRKFTPHLTYGRVKRHVNKLETINGFLKYQFESTENEVDKLIWFESRLTPNGAVHKPMRIYPLN